MPEQKTVTSADTEKPKQKFEIKLSSGTNKNLKELEAYLAASEVPLYVFGKTLVRPITSDIEAMEGRMTKTAELFDVEPQYLKVMAQENILFLKHKARSKKPVAVNPPMELIKDLMAMVGHWRFPAVVGVISTPTLRHDGSILSTAGYDRATRLLMIEPPALPAMPDKSSKGEAFEAIELLEELIDEFAFVDNTAKAVALSAMITPVVRGAIRAAPMHVNKAPSQANGKSYLFDIVAAIAIGQRMPVVAAGRNEEETEKRLGAVLISGRPIISIDNVNGELGGEALCQYLERPSVEIRVLGKSENRKVDPRNTAMFATGNNVTLTGEITRRALICTLDLNEERAEEHEYKKNPVEIVLKNRGRYIAACLTICRAYMQAGYPNKVKRLASYEPWSDIVRSALIWLGREDPVKSMDIARAEDPRTIDQEDIMTQWSKVIGTGEFHAMHLSKVIEICKENGDTSFDRFNLKYPDFYEAVCRVSSSYGKPPDQKRFGYWARGIQGKLCNGMKLVCAAPPSGGVRRWWIQEGDDPHKTSYGLRDEKVVKGNFNEPRKSK